MIDRRGSELGVDVSAAERADLEPWSVVERVARRLRTHVRRPQDLIETLFVEAARFIPAARDAGVILVGPCIHLRTVAATGPVPERLNHLQQELGSGPCLTAARKQIVVRMRDVATDTRWAPFCAAAQAAGVISMLCLPLEVDDQVMGTLSLYGAHPGAFAEREEAVARTLATLAALVLAESHRDALLQRALESRDLIGQAKGILMCRHAVTADAAFQMLVGVSQNTNTKLVDVAARVTETGTLDD